jgi:hypothetical protein
MAGNTIKTPEKEKKQKKNGNFSRFFSSMLDGTILSKDKAEALLPFLFFLGFLAIILIFNTYYAEKRSRELEEIRKEITELRVRYTSTKFSLMYLSNQSAIARALQDQGFVESTVPPRKITAHQQKKGIIGKMLGK